MKKLRSVAALVRTAAARVTRPGRHYGYIGFVGHANLGDEAMLEAAHALLGERVEPLATPAIERVLGAVGLGGSSRHPLVFLGGGTLVNGGYIDMVEASLGSGARVATLGTGVGSPGLSAGEGDLDPRWTHALARFFRVGVRGPLSLARLKAAGVGQAEILGDLALAMTPERPCSDTGARTLIFNTTAGKTEQDRALLAKFDTAMAMIMRELVEDGWRILPVSFHEDDVEPLRAVLDGAGLSGLRIEKPATFAQYKVLASTASASVSVRLHASVLASMCGVANLLLGYRSKCEDFCASIGVPENVIAYADFTEAELREKVARMIAGKAVSGTRLHAACLALQDNLRRYVEDVSRGVDIRPKSEGSMPS